MPEVLPFIRVAGSSYQQEAFEGVQPGDVVEFVSDPTNEHDPHAVKIMCKGQQLGFVPRDRAIEVKQAIRHPDYKGAVINKVGKPADCEFVGAVVQLTFG